MRKLALFTFLVLCLLATGCGRQKYKWGYINSSGRMVIKPQYELASSFSEGLAAVIDGDDVRYIDKSGKTVFKHRRHIDFDYAHHKTVNLRAYENEPRRVGDPVVANSFNEGMSVVTIEGDYAVVNRKGKIVIGPNDSWFGVGDFHCGRAMIQKGYDCGYIDKSGRVVIKPQFALAYDFSEGLARVKVRQPIPNANVKQKKNKVVAGISGKYGFIDRSGKMVIKTRYDDAGDFYDELTCVEVEGGKWGFIDKTGKMVLKPRWDDALAFYNGLAAVKSGSKWGMIDKSGKYVINPSYSQIGYYSEGLIPVEVNKKHGCVDRSGRIVVKPQFDMVYGFLNGRSRIREGKLFGFIDKTGRIVVKPRYRDAYNFSEGLAAVEM